MNVWVALVFELVQACAPFPIGLQGGSKFTHRYKAKRRFFLATADLVIEYEFKLHASCANLARVTRRAFIVSYVFFVHQRYDCMTGVIDNVPVTIRNEPVAGNWMLNVRGIVSDFEKRVFGIDDSRDIPILSVVYSTTRWNDRIHGSKFTCELGGP